MDGIERLGKAVIACIVIAGLCSTSLGKVIYVDDDAGGRTDGSSWANAYPYLQDALAAARQGDEVYVAQGVYRPNQGMSIQPQPPVRTRSIAVQATDPEGQSLAFQLKNGVSLLGGFAGVKAENPNTRDVEQYETILSGDLHGNDVAGWWPDNPVSEYFRTDNSVHVVESMEVDSTAVLDGFIIESANVSGMFSRSASPHVANCTFRNNGIQYGAEGPALHCVGGQPNLFHCTFAGNCANKGGGAILTKPATLLTLAECRFTGNWTMADGGAVRSEGGELSCTGCVFEKNAAQRGGAIYHTTGALGLTDCTFEGNMVSGVGGAVFVTQNATASMTGCLFSRNWAVSSAGAVHSEAALLTLSTCTFSGNSAMSGGALQASLARTPTGSGKVAVTQCLFTGNRGSGAGGALYVSGNGADSTIAGCTFADNWASTGATLGGYVNSSGDSMSRVIFADCIVWDGKGSLSSLTSPPPRVRTAAVGNEAVSITYSDVQGGWPGEGNIDADPLFAAPGHWVGAADPRTVVDPSYAYPVWVDGDYHLKSWAGRWDPQAKSWVRDDVTSPCIDAGDPNTPVGDEPAPNGGRINMGVYGGTVEASESS